MEHSLSDDRTTNLAKNVTSHGRKQKTIATRNAFGPDSNRGGAGVTTVRAELPRRHPPLKAKGRIIHVGWDQRAQVCGGSAKTAILPNAALGNSQPWSQRVPPPTSPLTYDSRSLLYGQHES